MVEKRILVAGDAGVHARPAMMLVREASKFPCSIKLIKEGQEGDCKSIMSVLGLAIVSGSELIIRAEGAGEAEAAENLATLIENNFKT